MSVEGDGSESCQQAGGNCQVSDFNCHPLPYTISFVSSGHVTAITVSPSHRRLGLAKLMMQLLEKMSDLADCYFVDLYVRMSNESQSNRATEGWMEGGDRGCFV